MRFATRKVSLELFITDNLLKLKDLHQEILNEVEYFT